MKKSIKKNYIFNTCYQLLLLIVPIVTTPYLSRVLGVENIGLNSFATAIVSYFTLFACLGTGTYGQRAVSYVQDDKEKRSKIFFETIIFRTVMVFVTLAFYGIFLVNTKDNIIIYLILSLNIVTCIFDITWFFQGLEEFQKTVTRNTIVKLLNIVFIFAFIKSESDLVIYIIGTAMLSFLGAISLWLYLPKYICKPTNIQPFKNYKTIIKLFIPTIAIQVYTILDKTMLGWFSGNNYIENGYYEQAEKIVKLCLTVVTSLSTVMISRIGNTFKNGNLDKLKNYMYRSYKFVWMFGIPIMFGIISIADFLVPILLGSGYEKVIILLPIFSVLVIAIGLSNVNGFQYFVPIGKENVLTLTVMVGAVSNLILNLILIPKYYSLGASIASIIAEILVTIVGFVYIYRSKQLSLRLIFSLSIKNIIAGVIMCVGVIFIKQFLSISILNLFFLILIGIIIYFLVLAILKDEMFRDLYNQVLNIIKQLLNKLKFIKVKKVKCYKE